MYKIKHKFLTLFFLSILILSLFEFSTVSINLNNYITRNLQINSKSDNNLQVSISELVFSNDFNKLSTDLLTDDL